jgi:hypothetical protein
LIDQYSSERVKITTQNGQGEITPVTIRSFISTSIKSVAGNQCMNRRLHSGMLSPGITKFPDAFTYFIGLRTAAFFGQTGDIDQFG